MQHVFQHLSFFGRQIVACLFIEHAEHVDMVLGAVTCAGKLSLLVEFVEDNIGMTTMEEIRERALALLLDA